MVMCTHQRFFQIIPIFRGGRCPRCISFFLGLSVIVLLSGCCSLPFVDCITRVKELKVTPLTIKMIDSPMESCTVKAWVLHSRNSRYDTATLDISMKFLHASSINVDSIVSKKVFNNEASFFKVGGKSEYIDFGEVQKKNEKATNSKALSETTYTFSVRVFENDFKHHQGTLVLSGIDTLETKKRQEHYEFKITY